MSRKVLCLIFVLFSLAACKAREVAVKAGDLSIIANDIAVESPTIVQKEKKEQGDKNT